MRGTVPNFLCSAKTIDDDDDDDIARLSVCVSSRRPSLIGPMVNEYIRK